MYDNKTLNSWWTQTSPYEDVFATVDFILENQGYRRLYDLHHLRLYSIRLSTCMSGKGGGRG